MRFLVPLSFVLISVSTSAQELSKNHFFFEAGGASFFYSANYERMMFRSTEKNLAVRAGIMYLNFFDDRGRVMKGIPFGISYLRRAANVYVELGISTSAIRDTYHITNDSGSDSRDVDELILLPGIRLGIRKYSTKSGLFWNALLQYTVILVSDYNDFRVYEKSSIPLPSFGIGYAF